jgi:hypothetical protein
MDNVNGLSPAQVVELLHPLEDGPHIQQDASGKRRLRHEYIRARLIQIFGFNGWGEQDLELTPIYEGKEKTGWVTVAYRARQRLIIRNPDGSVRTFFDGAGAWGSASSNSNRLTLWEVHSDAMNGARSVAFCRAAMSLGTQFGLSLYAEHPETAIVGYSLPHQVPHIYEAGDIEGEQQGIPGVDAARDPETARDPA